MAAFYIPALISLFALAGVGIWGGMVAFFTAALLAVLEVTLSFDNAVVNAKVLKRLNEKWQKRFLTWGIFISVFITRALLPMLIVAASVWVSPFVIAQIAYADPARYAELLETARYVIASFGGMFLTMVGLKYFFDDEKDVHWIHDVEKFLARWGHIEAAEIAITLMILLISSVLVPAHSLEILFAGIVGITLFILVHGITSSFSVEAGVTGAGVATFIYLNVLDSAFSLDSVIGAFALSTQLLVIVVGLGIGAYFVRALTLHMVHHGTLDKFIYIEHGAHWAILGLAGAMIASMFVHVPEPLTGLIGLVFVTLAFLSSKQFAQRG